MNTLLHYQHKHQSSLRRRASSDDDACAAAAALHRLKSIRAREAEHRTRENESTALASIEQALRENEDLEEQHTRATVLAAHVQSNHDARHLKRERERLEAARLDDARRTREESALEREERNVLMRRRARR